PARISCLRSPHGSDRHTKPLNVDWRTQESGIQGSLLLGQPSISSARTPSASRTERWDRMTDPIGSRSCAPLSVPSPICPAPEPLMDGPADQLPVLPGRAYRSAPSGDLSTRRQPLRLWLTARPPRLNV